MITTASPTSARAAGRPSGATPRRRRPAVIVVLLVLLVIVVLLSLAVGGKPIPLPEVWQAIWSRLAVRPIS